MKPGGHMSDETRAKISATLMGRPAWNKGVSPSEETRAKMSIARMGNTNGLGAYRSEETRAKISIAMKGRIASPETRAKESEAWEHRLPVSTETRAKESAAQKGHVMAESTRIALLNANLGSHPSAETRAKLSKFHKGLPSGSLSLRWKGGQAVTRRKFKAKRRTLGFVPLNTYFEGCEAHHLDHDRIVYIPRDLHRSIRHNQWTGKNMEQINALALSFIGGVNA